MTCHTGDSKQHTQRSVVFALTGTLLLLLCAGCARDDAPATDSGVLLQRGWEHLSIQDCDQADRIFRQVIASSPPDSCTAQMALYGLACSAQFRRPTGNPAVARKLYQQVVEEDKSGEVAPWAALALARFDLLERTRTGLERDDFTDPSLRDGYERVIRDYPGTLAAQEATLHLAASLFAASEEVQSARGIALVRQLLASHPDSPYRYGIEGQLAGEAYNRRDYQRQHEALKAMIESVKDPDRNMADLYYSIAYQAEARLQRADLAIPWYERLLEEFPFDPRCYQVRQALARLKASDTAVTGVGP